MYYLIVIKYSGTNSFLKCNKTKPQNVVPYCIVPKKFMCHETRHENPISNSLPQKTRAIRTKFQVNESLSTRLTQYTEKVGYRY